MRKTLYTRLKPEFKKGLETSNEKWEDCVDSITEELKVKLFYSDLSVGSISRLWLFSDVKGIYDRNGVDWKWGEDMFDEDDGCI